MLWYKKSDRETQIGQIILTWVAKRSANKRYFIIDQQIARIYCTTVNVFQAPLPFYATQIIHLFLNSRILANPDKGLVF